MNLAEKLKKARENAGFSQMDIAEKLNISRQAISKWENGWTSPDIDNLIILSDLYHISLDELLKDENNEKKKDVNLENREERNEKKVFGLLPEEVGIMIAVVCLSTIPCLGLIGIVLLIGYCIIKKHKIGTLYKILIMIFLMISIYNTYWYIRVEYFDFGEATIEKVASLSELYSRNF